MQKLILGILLLAGNNTRLHTQETQKNLLDMIVVMSSLAVRT
jgi:hypothetical protein